MEVLPESPKGQRLPTGTVTFLFTDIEGSTKLAQQYPDQWESLRARHHAILQSAMDAHNGYVFQIIGDAFCVAFHTARAGLRAAIEAQRKLKMENWEGIPIKVRMGLHTGAAEFQGTDYRGYLTLVRIQRVMSIGHGGQILISNPACELVRGELPADVTLRDMGEHRLKGLLNPEHLWQVGVPDLPQDFPPLPSLNKIPNNLPAQLTSFIGREKEISEVRQTLGSHRLVTLTGAGGTGKTRLSLEVAAAEIEHFPDGVWFIELAPLVDPELIPQTILTVLHLSEQADRTALQVLEEQLHPKKLLLILDNCEHLITDCATVAHTLLVAAPALKILASSREALGIQGEFAWHVPSLGLPDPQLTIQVEQFTQYEAVRLFIDRATMVQPHFLVTNENAPAVAQICHRLDGIPLAIELAAARLKILSTEQIAARLDDRFHLLTAGARTALPRQQTLRAMIDWSYNLLSLEERTMFRLFSVFVGGWTVEAAEAVCDHPDVLDLLSHLVDKSLVAVDREHDNVPRYSFLETIRQYAREKTEEVEESTGLRDRHLEYFLKFAEQSEKKMQGREQKQWLVRLEREHDNLRAALEWSLRSRPEYGLRISAALGNFWDTHGHITEARQWLGRMLDATRSLPPDSTRVRALAAAAYLASRHTDLEGWKSLVDQGLALSREINDKRSIAQCLIAKGHYLEYGQDNIRGAEPFYTEGLALARESGDTLFIGQALGPLASCALNRYEYEQAEELFRESLALFRQVENEREIAGALANLAEVALIRCDWNSAYAWAEEGLALYKELEDKHGIATALRALCYALLNQGRSKEAQQAGQQSVNLFRELIDPGCLGLSLVSLAGSIRAQGDLSTANKVALEAATTLQEANTKVAEMDALDLLGRIALSQGDLAGAKKQFRVGFSLAQEVQDFSRLPSLLEGLGSVLASSSRYRDAILLFGAADALREKTRRKLMQTERADYDRTLLLLQSRVDEATFQKAWQEGRALPAEDVIRLALDESL